MTQQPLRIAINGFGRIGRTILRILMRDGADFELACINEIEPLETCAYLFQYDSVFGPWPGTVTREGAALVVDGRAIPFHAARDLSDLDLSGVDVVLDCTGMAGARAVAERGLAAGARMGLVSGPSEEADITVVLGANEGALAGQRIVSNASCTTNALAPLARLLDEAYGIESGQMTTVHCYTGSQPTVDKPRGAPERSRAAALSMVPTTTSAQRLTGLVLPGLAGRIEARAVRVPVASVSAIDLTVQTREAVTAEAVGARLEADGNESGGLWSPVSVTRHKDGSTGLFPHLSLDRAKPGLIAVNSAGRRFVNEGLSYHDFVEAMYRSHETVPTMPAWLVCDAAFVKKYGIGVIYPGTTDLRPHAESGYATVAETLDGLARALGIDADGLRDTVDRHNRFAAEGSDPDFGKGDLELNRFNGDPEAGPNPCLGPIGTPPFVAVAVWPAEIACSIGLSTTASAEVVNGDGQSIPGLYACGNDMASVMAGTYPGPGTTLGPGMVFGYRAAMHAAAARRAAN